MTRLFLSRRLLTVLCIASLAALVVAPSATTAITTTDLNTQTATAVAQSLVGPGVTIANVTYVGANVAAGTFAGGGLVPRLSRSS